MTYYKVSENKSLRPSLEKLLIVFHQSVSVGMKLWVITSYQSVVQVEISLHFIKIVTLIGFRMDYRY